MNWFSGIIVYLLIWWLVLCAVLPWRVKPPRRPETGMASSAPIAAHIGIKCVVTSIIAAFLWVGVYVLIKSGVIDYRYIASQMN